MTRARLKALPVLVACISVAACGHRIDRAELLAANGAATTQQLGASDSAQSTTDGLETQPGSAQSDSTQSGPSDGGAATASAQGGQRAETSAAAQGSAAATGCTTPGSTAPIRLGSVGNYSGPAGSSLAPIVDAERLWVEWTNKHGGLCGHEVQLIVVDDHSDPAQHRAALQDLVESRGVMAFVNAAALTGAAGVDYLQKVKVPQIGMGCDDGPQAASPIYFLGCNTSYALAYGSARNVALLGPGSPNVGAIFCRESENCGSRARKTIIGDGGAQKAGLNVVYDTDVSITQPDYTAECRGAQSAGAKSLLVFLDAASVRRFAQSCTRQGYDPVYSQVSATVVQDTKDFPGLQNLLVSLDSFPFNAAFTASQREFQAAMKLLRGTSPGPGEALGWLSGKMFERAAMDSAKASGTITTAGVVEAFQRMRNETFDGLTAPISYRPNGPGTYPSCWFPITASNGTWKTVNEGKPLCVGD